MAAPLGSDAMVGRADVLERLLQTCAKATDGYSAVVVITGEAGVGKSRLCAEVAGRARTVGFEVAEARCWSHGGAPPLWPWRDLLKQADPAGAPLGSGERRVTLTGWPGLTAGFDVFEGAADRLGRACRRNPWLLVLDDLHEADEGTLLLTRFLASQLRSSRLVVLVTLRSGATVRGSREEFLVSEVERESAVIDLAGLDRDALAELVAGSGHPADERTVDVLLQITKGNPLVAHSVLRAAPPGPLDSTLSLGVAEAFQRRLRSVDPAVTAVLGRAALLGTTAAVDEIALVAERSPDDVRAAAIIGQQLQVLLASSPATIEFTHDLVRAAVEATLAPAERLETHARAVEAVLRSERSADGVLRAVRHALAACSRSDADAARAVELAQQAAAILMDRHAFSDAAGLLGQAIDALEQTGQKVPAGLRIERAHAMLAAGRVGEAHHLAVIATQSAEAEGDPVDFAEAAAGLGGIWINNVRSPVEQARMLAMQRAALAGVPPEHHRLAVRLYSRALSGAMFWEGAPIDPVLEVIAMARQVRDPAVPLEVFSNVHTALLGPDWSELRLELAEEMVRLAGDVNGGIYALMAYCWRAVDLFLVGSDQADGALADLRGPAEALQCLSVLYVVRLVETMQLIMAGRVEEAEQAALAALELGQRAEDADALGYFGVQLLAIRWLQSRDAEMLTMLETIAGSENVIRGDQGFNAAVAAVAARAGQMDVARRYLARVLEGPGVDGIPKFSTWLATLAAVVEAASALGDEGVSAATYDLLVPYGGLPVRPSLAVVCFGSTQHVLGQAARTAGRLDAAISHFEAAIDANVKLGNLPRAAMSRMELAAALGRRDGPGDRDQARTRRREAIAAAARLGLDELARQWSDREGEDAHEVRAGPIAAPATQGAPGSGALTIRRDDRRFVVEHDGDKVAFADRVGMRYLAQLVANPGQSITAHALMTGEEERTVARQAVLDRAARDSLEARARELAALIATARADGDVVVQGQLEDEFDVITDELRKATALGQRDRFFGDDAERARTAVRKAIVRAVNEIEAALPTAGELLRSSITTGIECRYDPPR
ncbi:MAG: AAA family ATPase [Actinobacteria bacterium]|nr:AAA family ATPase [Actinomycetota bacterium]